MKARIFTGDPDVIEGVYQLKTPNATPDPEGSGLVGYSGLEMAYHLEAHVNPNNPNAYDFSKTTFLIQPWFVILDATVPPLSDIGFVQSQGPANNRTNELYVATGPGVRVHESWHTDGVPQSFYHRVLNDVQQLYGQPSFQFIDYPDWIRLAANGQATVNVDLPKMPGYGVGALVEWYAFVNELAKQRFVPDAANSTLTDALALQRLEQLADARFLNLTTSTRIQRYGYFHANRYNDTLLGDWFNGYQGTNLTVVPGVISQ